MKRLFLLLLPLSFVWISGFSQTEEEEVTFEVHGKDTVYPLNDGRVIFDEKIYKLNAPYLTLAYGAGNNFTQGGLEQNMMISYHYFFKNFGLGLGYHSSSDQRVWWRSYQKQNDFWLGAGWRLEKHRFNLGAFIGPSLAYGSYIAWSDEDQENRAYGYTTLGGVAELQATYRVLYDVGVGLSLYGSYNSFYSVAGAQVHLYFSTAFVRNY